MIAAFQQIVHHHWITEGAGLGAVAMWAFSAIVSSMPPLPSNANYWAKWAYAGLHALAANIDKVHVPGSAADMAAQPAISTKQPGA
jgi:hypothetical protein